MGDSPIFTEVQTGKDPITHFGDLANRILDGQIASRTQPQPDNSNPPSPRPWIYSQPWQAPVSPEPRFQPDQNGQNQSPGQWKPLEINPPAGRPAYQPPIPSPESKQDPAPVIDHIPTLRAGQPANVDDNSTFAGSSKESEIYRNNKDSVVRVYGHGRDQPADREYTGTGFFVSNHGDIATAYHVISGLESIKVTTSDGIEHPAKVVSIRPSSDVAIISIGSDQSTKPVSLAQNSNFLHGGEPLFTIGHPAGWPKEYLSPGNFISTDTARDITGVKDIDGQNPHHILLTTSQNIQGGDSGGPVFDAQGQVIGIVSRGDQGSHGYMVSVNDLWPIMDKVAPPVQSTTYRPSDLPFALHFGLEETSLTASSALIGAQLLRNSRAFRLGGTAGSFWNAGIASTALVQQDLPFLHSALAQGTTREKVSAIADVSGDALMIGGAAMSFVPRLRPAAPVVSLAGSLVKLGNGVGSFRTYY